MPACLLLSSYVAILSAVSLHGSFVPSVPGEGKLALRTSDLPGSNNSSHETGQLNAQANTARKGTGKLPVVSDMYREQNRKREIAVQHGRGGGQVT